MCRKGGGLQAEGQREQMSRGWNSTACAGDKERVCLTRWEAQLRSFLLLQPALIHPGFLQHHCKFHLVLDCCVLLVTFMCMSLVISIRYTSNWKAGSILYISWDLFNTMQCNSSQFDLMQSNPIQFNMFLLSTSYVPVLGF